MESGRVTIVETLILVLMGGPTRLGCSHAASSAKTGTTGSTSFSRAKRTESLYLNVIGTSSFARKKTGPPISTYRRNAGGPASIADDPTIRGSPVTLRHRLSTGLL